MQIQKQCVAENTPYSNKSLSYPLSVIDIGATMASKPLKYQLKQQTDPPIIAIIFPPARRQDSSLI